VPRESEDSFGRSTPPSTIQPEGCTASGVLPASPRRKPKKTTEWGGASSTSGIRRSLRVGHRLSFQKDPKAPSADQPALSSPRPKPRRLEHLRSPRSKRPLLNRAGPSEAEASSKPIRFVRG
jgi:hypothetical protein